MVASLAGVNVLDFGHTVMGPSCAVILADLGATVIHVEPTSGDPTRDLVGFGSGFFGYLNRNKSSLAVNLKDARSRPALEAGLAWADVLIENFGPGAMDRLSLGVSRACEINQRLIYCSLKGFLPGPYEHRPALDEVVQMMGGLAYMTGPTGQPLRAGASVVDIAGGMFGAIGILAALRERDATGKGKHVQSALFETTAFLVGQHMAMAAFGGTKVTPMPEREQAWGIYDLFNVLDGQMFLAVTSDQQWTRFCKALGLGDLLADTRLASNRQRVEERDWLLPALALCLKGHRRNELEALCDAARIPCAQVSTPLDLLDDEHLSANGSLLNIIHNRRVARLPALPIRFDADRPEVRLQPPAVGEQSIEILECWGLPSSVVIALVEAGVVRANNHEVTSVER